MYMYKVFLYKVANEFGTTLIRCKNAANVVHRHIPNCWCVVYLLLTEEETQIKSIFPFPILYYQIRFSLSILPLLEKGGMRKGLIRM